MNIGLSPVFGSSIITHKSGTFSRSNRFNYLIAPLVTLTPYGNLEIITHIPRNAETTAAFHQMTTTVPAKVQQVSSWPKKTVHI